MKNTVSEDLFPEVYRVAKAYYEKECRFAEGLADLHGNFQMNIETAKAYIYAFRNMLQGQRFTRTLNISSLEYLLDRIERDYGRATLRIALTGLHKHIVYYETAHPRMIGVHEVYDRFLAKLEAPVLIVDTDQLKHNLAKLEYYLSEGNAEEQKFASERIRNGICFVAYQVGNEIRYAPSKFVGYVNNTMDIYRKGGLHGTQATSQVSTLLGAGPIVLEELEINFLAWCANLGIEVGEGGKFNHQRRYWRLELKEDFEANSLTTGEFPEGKLVERKHKSRERNRKVVEIAKSNYKLKNGHLKCEVCKFDFEKEYGKLGADFIEGHHVIAVKDMLEGHVTRPEDIALLCSNCHRMVHRRRPWLSMDKLKLILNLLE